MMLGLQIHFTENLGADVLVGNGAAGHAALTNAIDRQSGQLADLREGSNGLNECARCVVCERERERERVCV